MELYEKTTVTCEEMKQLEDDGESAGLPKYDMMENAGMGAAAFISDHVQLARGQESAAIFCGKGNNGGDGLVAARKLAEDGWKVYVILVEGEPVTGDAIKNYELLRQICGNDAGHAVEIMNLDQAEKAGITDLCSICIDSIYGTGFHGSLRPNGAAAVSMINEMKKEGKLVFALDIPSGLTGDHRDSDQKPEPGQAVCADYTITFHARKPVHDCAGLADFLGQTITCDIGIGDILRKDKA